MTFRNKKAFINVLVQLSHFQQNAVGRVTHWNVENLSQRHGRLQACKIMQLLEKNPRNTASHPFCSKFSVT